VQGQLDIGFLRGLDQGFREIEQPLPHLLVGDGAQFFEGRQVFDQIVVKGSVEGAAAAGDGFVAHLGSPLEVRGPAPLKDRHAGLAERANAALDALDVLVAARSSDVLVQPEMERGCSPLVSIPLFGRVFLRHAGKILAA